MKRITKLFRLPAVMLVAAGCLIWPVNTNAVSGAPEIATIAAPSRLEYTAATDELVECIGAAGFEVIGPKWDARNEWLSYAYLVPMADGAERVEPCFASKAQETRDRYEAALRESILADDDRWHAWDRCIDEIAPGRSAALSRIGDDLARSADASLMFDLMSDGELSDRCLEDFPLWHPVEVDLGVHEFVRLENGVANAQ